MRRVTQALTKSGPRPCPRYYQLLPAAPHSVVLHHAVPSGQHRPPFRPAKAVDDQGAVPPIRKGNPSKLETADRQDCLAMVVQVRPVTLITSWSDWCR